MYFQKYVFNWITHDISKVKSVTETKRQLSKPNHHKNPFCGILACTARKAQSSAADYPAWPAVRDDEGQHLLWSHSLLSWATFIICLGGINQSRLKYYVTSHQWCTHQGTAFFRKCAFHDYVNPKKGNWIRLTGTVFIRTGVHSTLLWYCNEYWWQ